MPELAGWQRYLVMRKEDAWGVKSSINPDIPIPYAEYSVATRVEVRAANLFTGVRPRRHARPYRANIAGRLAMPLVAYYVADKSMAQHLLEWAMSGAASPFLPSYTAELSEVDIDNKRHLGLRVDSMTLAGDAETGIVSLSLELQGKSELGGIVAPTLTTPAPPVEFLFSGVTLYLSDASTASSAGGEEESVAIHSFRLRIDNNLRVHHVASFPPTVIAAGVRETSLRFRVLKSSNTFDVIRRAMDSTERACRLVLLGRHLGTGPSGEFTRIEFHFDRLSFAGAVDHGKPNDLVSQEVDWIALKPDTTSSDVDVTFGVD